MRARWRPNKVTHSLIHSLTHSHLNSQTKAERCHQMSQKARSESTNEYKHEPHTPPVLRANMAELQRIRGTVFLEKKNHSLGQTLRAYCTFSLSCPRRFHFLTHRVVRITDTALLPAAPPQFLNSFIPFRSKNFLRAFLFQFLFNNKIYKVLQLLAYSTRSQEWGCHLNLWAGWFSVGVSSPSLWRSPFSTRQWCWFWPTLGILFPHYPPYLVSLPLSATWGGARLETSPAFNP